MVILNLLFFITIVIKQKILLSYNKIVTEELQWECNECYKESYYFTQEVQRGTNSDLLTILAMFCLVLQLYKISKITQKINCKNYEVNLQKLANLIHYLTALYLWIFLCLFKSGLLLKIQPHWVQDSSELLAGCIARLCLCVAPRVLNEVPHTSQRKGLSDVWDAYKRH